MARSRYLCKNILSGYWESSCSNPRTIWEEINHLDTRCCFFVNAAEAKRAQTTHIVQHANDYCTLHSAAGFQETLHAESLISCAHKIDHI